MKQTLTEQRLADLETRWQLTNLAMDKLRAEGVTDDDEPRWRGWRGRGIGRRGNGDEARHAHGMARGESGQPARAQLPRDPRAVPREGEAFERDSLGDTGRRAGEEDAAGAGEEGVNDWRFLMGSS